MKQGYFRFILDDHFEIVDQPLGWQDAKIVLERNDEYNSLFLSYLTELKFWGDGYQYIRSQINAIGYCLSVKIKIDYQCNRKTAFERVFEGYINIPNTEIDEEACLVTANIEPDNVYANFLRASEAQIPVYTKGPNGETVGDTTFQNFNYHKVSSGVSLYETQGINYGLNVAQLLDYLVAYYTTNQIRVVSDFFTDQVPRKEVWEIEFTGPALKSGDVIDIEYINYFGKVISASVNFASSEANTLNLIGREFINQINLTSTLRDAFASSYFDHTRFATFSVSGRVITLEAWIPMTINEVTVTGSGGTAVATFDKTTEYQKGGKNLILISQIANLAGSPINANYSGDIFDTLSFKQLFLELDKIYCLGMQMQKDSGTGQRYLRIEPLEYFYNESVVLSLEGPINIRTKYEKEKNYNSVELDSKADFVYQDYVITDVLLTGTSGGSPTTIAGSSTDVRRIGLGYYRILITDSTNEEVYLRSQVPTGQFLINSYTAAPVYYVIYNQSKAPSALVNRSVTGYVGSCIGDSLNLKNEFVTDIERHGDQTVTDPDENHINHSASPSQTWSFLQLNSAGTDTEVYKYKIFNVGGGAGGPHTVLRYAFNGHLTNHHKIINNYLRIKNDVTVNTSPLSQDAGEVLSYHNDAGVRPFVIHEFDYFLSFNDILSMVENPRDTIEIDIKGNGIFTKCWIKRIEMDVNTKKTKFELYEA